MVPKQASFLNLAIFNVSCYETNFAHPESMDHSCAIIPSCHFLTSSPSLPLSTISFTIGLELVLFTGFHPVMDPEQPFSCFSERGDHKIHPGFMISPRGCYIVFFQ